MEPSQRPTEQENSERENRDSAPQADGPANAKERLYDKIPLTLRQVDLLIGALVAVLLLVLVVGIIR